MSQITSILPKTLAAGINGHYVHGEHLTFGFVILEKDSVVPLHQHHQEQITYILEGQLQMQIGENEYLLEPGMYHVIASNTKHSAIALTDCKLIDVFSPVREDYKQ